MSEEPDLVELTRRAYGFAKVRDWDAVVSFYGPDTDWDMTPAGLNKYAGPTVLRQFFVEWTDSYKQWDLELEEVRDLGNDATFAVVLTRGRSGRRAVWVDLRFATIVRWAGGRMARITSYTDIDQARTAAARVAGERR